jgi:hypothetical protein
MTLALSASPPQAQPSPVYSGIGATVAAFKAAHQNGYGHPPVGITYYRVDWAHGGRVGDYHVVVGWRSYRSLLPADAKLVQPYNGYCAIYESRWIRRVFFAHLSPHGPKYSQNTYVIVYVPTRAGAKRHGVGYGWNGANASLRPKCRG